MNVLVEEQCLKDIAESIRKKGGLTTTYKPREMSVAIDNLQTGGSGCLVKIEQSANQKITATYNGKTYTDEFFVLIGESFETSIKADNHYTAGTVNYNGTPLKGDITVKATAATEAPKYCVTIEQSANQTITATYDGQTYTSTFYAYVGSQITFAVKANNGYIAGTLNYIAVLSLDSDITVRATQAKVKEAYDGETFYITDSNTYNKFCKFQGTTEEFTIRIISSNAVSVINNRNFVNFLKNHREVNFEYKGTILCTFNYSDKSGNFNYNKMKDLSNRAELTVRVG